MTTIALCELILCQLCKTLKSLAVVIQGLFLTKYASTTHFSVLLALILQILQATSESSVAALSAVCVFSNIACNGKKHKLSHKKINKHIALVTFDLSHYIIRLHFSHFISDITFVALHMSHCISPASFVILYLSHCI